MKYSVLTLIFIILVSVSYADDKTVTVDPNEIQINDYVHKELPPSLLKRIKATTDVFEPIDGISYEKAVDLYKRDLDPDGNLIIWEEMARVYKTYCSSKSKCSSADERMDIYRTLLIRSVYPEETTIQNLKLKILTMSEAINLVKEYKLDARPIEVIKK